MLSGGTGQENPYKGYPLRAWIRARFEKADGTGSVEMDLVADLGDPTEGHISTENMQQLKVADTQGHVTNFGAETGGWVCINMPEVGLEK
jgi:hypothetical protein